MSLSHRRRGPAAPEDPEVRAAVLREIRDAGRRTSADLAGACGLSVPTLYRVVAALRDLGHDVPRLKMGRPSGPPDPSKRGIERFEDDLAYEHAKAAVRPFPALEILTPPFLARDLAPRAAAHLARVEARASLRRIAKGVTHARAGQTEG